MILDYLLLWALLASAAGGMPAIPSLNQLQLARFEPAAREQIQAALAAARANPTDAEANGRLGMTLQAYELRDLAPACFQRAHRLAPKSFRWAYYWGSLEAWLGKANEAVPILRLAIQLQRDYLPARLKLAEALLNSGQLEESERIYRTLGTEHPRSALAYYGLGRVLSARSDVTAAMESYRKACQLFPNFGAAHYALAMAYRDLREAAKSKEHLSLFERHREAIPEEPDPLLEAMAALKSGADHHFKEGFRLQAAGRFREALAEYERVLKIDNSSAKAHAGLLSTYLSLGELDKAEERYRAVLKVDPNNYEAHHHFGVLRYMQGRYQEAAEAYRKALEINGSYAPSETNLGFLVAAEGHFDEAARHFRSALENQPNQRLAHLGLGRILLSQGKGERAIDHFLRAITVDDSETPRFMYTLAAAYAHLEKPQEALHYAREAKQRATALGQTKLVAEIDELMKGLGQPKSAP